MLHFLNVGLYDGLFIMQDTETDTLWNHITGEALYGELAGHRMPVSNLLQSTVSGALETNPDMEVALSDRPVSGMSARLGPGNANAQLGDPFIETLGTEDNRRERMEMGLGIWTDSGGKYYPLAAIRGAGRAFVDEFDGQDLVVYVDPLSSTPAAVFVDAKSASVEGRDVVLDGGRKIVAGRLLDANGKAADLEKPLQIFTRWYGFALTVPEPEIYGE